MLVINRVHAHTKVNDWAKYEQDLRNIMGCRVIMGAGQTDGKTDGQKDARTQRQMAHGTTIRYSLNGQRVIRVPNFHAAVNLTGVRVQTLAVNLDRQKTRSQTKTKFTLPFHKGQEKIILDSLSNFCIVQNCQMQFRGSHYKNPLAMELWGVSCEFKVWCGIYLWHCWVACKIILKF